MKQPTTCTHRERHVMKQPTTCTQRETGDETTYNMYRERDR